FIADRRRHTEEDRHAALDLRADEVDQRSPCKHLRRPDDVELEPGLRVTFRNALASSDDVDEDAATVWTPFVAQRAHSPPAAIPPFAYRWSVRIDPASAPFDAVFAEDAGELFQFRHIDFGNFATDRAAAALTARHQLLIALTLAHSGRSATAFECR